MSSQPHAPVVWTCGREQSPPQRREASTNHDEERPHTGESDLQACRRIAKRYRPPRRRSCEPLSIEAQGEGEEFHPEEHEQP